MISEGHRNNLETLKQVFANDDAALVQCTDKATGKPVVALCAVVFNEEAEEFEIVPFAKMFDSNPYEDLLPPGAEEEETPCH